MTTYTVTIPVPLGGTGTTYRSDAGAYGMASNSGYGYTTYLMPMLGETIAACQAVVTAANAAAAGTAANGTSATNRTPSIGSTTWVYEQADKLPSIGMRMRAASRAAPATNWAIGTVTGYNGGTSTVTISVDQIGESPSSASDWNLILEGQPGATAAYGLTGTTLASNVVNASLNSITPSGGDLTVTGSTLAQLSSSDNGTFRGFRFGIVGNSTVYGGSEMNMTSGEVRHTAGLGGYGGYHTWYANGNLKATLNGAGFYLSNIQEITANSASPALRVTQSGAGPCLRLTGLPTSAAGLSAGDIWNDSGTLKVA